MKSVLTGSICILGHGCWGSSLLAALQGQGIVTTTVDLRKGSPGRTRAAGPGRPTWPQAEIFWLCVPDGELIKVVRQLVRGVECAGGSMRGRVVLHSSGVSSSAVLKAAQVAGAAVGSVHPLMSFPTLKPVSLDGVPFAVEAQGKLRIKLFRLVRALGGEPFAIRPEDKALYHAAAVIASPLLVSLAAAVEETARLAGLSAKKASHLLQPIMAASLRNFFRDGAGKSFSGPFARGDAKTVSLHLAALQAHPLLEQVYRSLALYAVDTLPVTGREKLRRSLRAGR